MKTNKDFRNEMFKRQELVLELKGDKNPSFSETRKAISEKFGKPEENIDVYGINGSFGNDLFEISAYIYDSKEKLEEMKNLRETQKQKKKEAEEQKKLAEEKPAEEKPAEEKPAEEDSKTKD